MINDIITMFDDWYDKKYLLIAVFVLVILAFYIVIKLIIG